MNIIQMLGVSLGLFANKEPWRCTQGKRCPNGRVIGAQCEALRSVEVSSNDKTLCLQHIRDLAAQGPEVQLALSRGKVLDAVFEVFYSASNAMVKAAAKGALEALCVGSRDNCIALMALGHSVLFHDTQFRAAKRTTADLLRHLVSSEPAVAAAMVEHFKLADHVGELVCGMRHWNMSAHSQPSFSDIYMGMQEALLGVLHSVASTGGVSMCRQLFEGGLMDLILELARAKQHAMIARCSLALLGFMLAQVPAHRTQLEEKGGVEVLWSVLDDKAMPLLVRHEAVNVLTVACSSPKVATAIKLRGLDILIAMLSSYTTCRPVSGAQASLGLSGASAIASSVSAPYRTSAGAPTQEPYPAMFVERMLMLLGAVVVSSDATQELLEEQRLHVLLDLLNFGLMNFGGDDYRVATAAAQVLFRLCSKQGMTLAPELRGPNVSSPLYRLVILALKHASAATNHDARVLHGALCALGVLCKGLDFEQRCGSTEDGTILLIGKLRFLVDLLSASTAAILVAVGAEPPPYMGTTMQSVYGNHQAKGMRPDGHAYLILAQVMSDMRTSVRLLLQLLWDMVQVPFIRGALASVGLMEILKKLLSWRKVQFPVTRLLSLLGSTDSNYTPLSAYGRGQHLVALLNLLKLDPRPFVERGVSPGDLLAFDDITLQRKFGLNKSGIMQLAALRAAHTVFVAVDKDGDGCITADDFEDYLVNDLNQRLGDARMFTEQYFTEMQVEIGEPVNFLQFLEAYLNRNQSESDGELLHLLGDMEAGTGRDEGVGRAPKKQRRE